MEFQLVENPAVFPQLCICGNYKGWMVDTGIVQGVPSSRIYLCERCVAAIDRATSSGRCEVAERDAALVEARTAKARVAQVEEELRRAVLDFCPSSERDAALRQLESARGEITRLSSAGKALDKRDAAEAKAEELRLLLAAQEQEIREAQVLGSQLASARDEAANLRAENAALSSALATSESLRKEVAA